MRRLRSAVTNRSPGPRGGEQDEAEQQGPDDAVRDDLDRTARLQQREVQRGARPTRRTRRRPSRLSSSRGARDCSGGGGGVGHPTSLRSPVDGRVTPPLVSGCSNFHQRCRARCTGSRPWCSAPSAGDPGGRHTPCSAGPHPQRTARRHHPVRVARMQAGRRDDATAASGPTTTSAPPRGVHHVSTPATRPRRAALGAARRCPVLGRTDRRRADRRPERHRRTRHHATRRRTLPVDLDAMVQECTHAARPGRLRLGPESPAATSTRMLAGQWWTSTSRSATARAQGGHPRPVHRDDRARCRAAGVKVITDAVDQPHVGPDQRGHRLRGPARSPRRATPARARLRPAGLPQLPGQHRQLQRPVPGAELPAGRALGPRTPRATTCARRSPRTSTTSSRSASPGSASTPSKHMAAGDLAAHQGKLDEPERVHRAGGHRGRRASRSSRAEYCGLGRRPRVHLRAEPQVRVPVRATSPALSRSQAPAWACCPPTRRRAFVDNHDTERNGDTLQLQERLRLPPGQPVHAELPVRLADASTPATRSATTTPVPRSRATARSTPPSAGRAPGRARTAGTRPRTWSASGTPSASRP